MPICFQELYVETKGPASAEKIGLEEAFRGAFEGYVSMLVQIRPYPAGHIGRPLAKHMNKGIAHSFLITVAPVSSLCQGTSAVLRCLRVLLVQPPKPDKT